MVNYLNTRIGPGLHASARLILAALLLFSAPAAAAQAPSQARSATPAPNSAIDALVVNKLIWSTMSALDHANQTGNYSVLRDLGAPSFQANNSAATLGGIFETIRTQRVDLSNTLLVEPTFEIPPAVVEGGLLRAKGYFGLRPRAVAFDLIFQNVAGYWRVLGISVAPVELTRPAQPR